MTIGIIKSNENYWPITASASVAYALGVLGVKTFHCDAIIPVVKLFWWAALEPTTNSQCKPGQSQWVLLKLESCCDVIK